VTPEIVDWKPSEAEAADDFSIRVAAATGRVVGWLEARTGYASLRSGLAVVPRGRFDLERLREPFDARWAIDALDLRVLRRVRDQGLTVDAVRAALADNARLPPVASLDEEERLPAISIDEAVFGPGRGARGELPVRIEGWLATRPPIHALVVRIGPRRYYVAVDRDRADVASVVPWIADTRCGFRFEHGVEGLPGGEHLVILERIDGRELLELGRIVVEAPAPESADSAADAELGQMPTIRIERLTLDWRGAEPRLELTGSVALERAIDCVRLRYGGGIVFDADPAGVLREEPVGSRLRLELSEPIEVEKQFAPVRVELVRRQEVVASWEGNPVLTESSTGPLRIVSPALDRLQRASPVAIWGDLRLDGGVAGDAEGGEIVLEMDGETAAVARLRRAGRFVLRASDPGAGERRAEVVLRKQGDVALRSAPFVVRLRTAAAPRGWAARLERLTGALEPWAPGWSGVDVEALANRLAGRSPQVLDGIDWALTELAKAAEAAVASPARIVRELPPAPERPLDVLFASWEIPWGGHGGGQAMLNLLRTLGTRHRITLLHPIHPGSEGLSDVLRPWVHEILTVPRGWQAGSDLAPYAIPLRYQQTFSPGLRAALAAESASGRYDVVNLEFEGMAVHAPRNALAPTLGVLIEPASFARLAEFGAPAASLDETAAAFEEVLRALAFDVGLVARRFPTLVTLTQPEAALLARFLPGRELLVNPIAIDVARLANAAGGAERAAAPTFVFVGNFRHPPNRDALAALVDSVAVELRRRLPRARLLVAGSDPPPALVDRGDAAGVTFAGWVDDLPRLLGSVTGFLAPIHSGSGMRVKLLEAMACGCAVVSTALGMSGIAARPGAEFLQAETPQDFVEAAALLVEQEARRSAIAAAGQRLVERDHGLTVQAGLRERIWQRVASTGSPG